MDLDIFRKSIELQEYINRLENTINQLIQKPEDKKSCIALNNKLKYEFVMYIEDIVYDLIIKALQDELNIKLDEFREFNEHQKGELK